MDVLKQRSGQSLSREEASALVGLINGSAHANGDAPAAFAAPGAGGGSMMPPPPAVGLFQTPSSAGPSAAAAPEDGETAFSSVRQYLQQSNAERRQQVFSLPNARGVSRPAAVGWGGAPPRGHAGGTAPPTSAWRSYYGTPQQAHGGGGTPAPQPQQHFALPGPSGGAQRGAGGYGGGYGGYGGGGYGGGDYGGGGMGTGFGGAARSPQPAGYGGWGAPASLGKRGRDAAELDAHAREQGRSTAPRLSNPAHAAPGSGTMMPPPAPMPMGSTPAPAPWHGAPAGAGATGGKEPAASSVTTDTARRILQTLDRLVRGLLRTSTRVTSNLLLLLLCASVCTFTLKVSHAGSSDLDSSACSE